MPDSSFSLQALFGAIRYAPALRAGLNLGAAIQAADNGQLLADADAILKLGEEFATKHAATIAKLAEAEKADIAAIAAAAGGR